MPRINRTFAAFVSVCFSVFLVAICSINLPYERPLSLFFQDWHLVQDLRGEVDKRLKREKADMSPSDIRVTLLWSNADDLDLIVRAPDGSIVDFRHKIAAGMILDVDMNASFENVVDNPIENVRVDQGSALEGAYEIRVNQFRRRGSIRETQFLLKVTVSGNEQYFEGIVSNGRDFATRINYRL
jgi:hypothetical protein